jgi:CheY-like chemotaxis protein
MSSSGEPEILFVEDNPFDVELTLRALKGCGFSDRVKVARDGKEALDYLFGEGPYKGRRIEEGPRLVLLDL